MNRLLLTILNAVYHILFFGLIIFAAIGILYQFMGHGNFQQMLKTIGLGNSYDSIWVTAYVILISFIIVSIVKEKLKK